MSFGKFRSGTLACRFRKHHGEKENVLTYFAPRTRDEVLLKEVIQHIPVFKDRSLILELERRGYDVTTLEFTIRTRRGIPGGA